jgi:beta-catenin-like protein 1
VDAEEEEEDADTEAGPAPPPADGEDEEEGYGPSRPPEDEDEDEEGRFFGGGITAVESEILDYVDGVDTSGGAANVKIDSSWLRKTATTLERRVARNAEQRARFADEPARFIESEAEVDAGVRSLAAVAERPDLYEELASLGVVSTLVGLLSHENADVAIAALEVIGELTGEDVEAEEAQWGALVDALLDADVLPLLVGNLGRLDESQEADRDGVYHALEVVENLCSRRETAEKSVGKEEGLLKWLLSRVAKAENPVTQNKQYAGEILAILVQSSRQNRVRLAALDAVDTLLQLVAAYRKRDPEKGGEEEEYMENVFEALTCLVDEPEGKRNFIEAEGVELCLIMLKEGKMSKPPSLRLLDHAVGGSSGGEVCRKLVEEGGLKTTFTMFMKKNDSQTIEHLIGIFSWMLRSLPGNSAERIRTLAKFVEKDYEKTTKLVKLRRDYAGKVDAVQQQIDGEAKGLSEEEKEELADDWFSRRLDAGLFCLQTIDVILAWLIAEDDGAKKQIQTLLADRDQTLSVIRETLQEQLDGIDGETDDGKETRDMLATLIDFL